MRCNWGQLKLQWLSRLTFQSRVTANTGACTVLVLKLNMIYCAVQQTCFITQTELLAFTCITVLKKDIQDIFFQMFLLKLYGIELLLLSVCDLSPCCEISCLQHKVDWLISILNFKKGSSTQQRNMWQKWTHTIYIRLYLIRCYEKTWRHILHLCLRTRLSSQLLKCYHAVIQC